MGMRPASIVAIVFGIVAAGCLVGIILCILAITTRHKAIRSLRRRWKLEAAVEVADGPIVKVKPLDNSKTPKVPSPREMAHQKSRPRAQLVLPRDEFALQIVNASQSYQAPISSIIPPFPPPPLKEISRPRPRREGEPEARWIKESCFARLVPEFVEDLKLVPDLVEDADAEPLGPLEDEMRSEYSQDTISDSESCQSENEDLLSVKEMDTSSVAEVIFEDRIQNTALSPEDLAEVCHIYATDAPEYHETSPELSILSYNVRCDKDKWPYDWKSRFAPVVDVISSSNTDIVCLQEARHQFAQDVVAALGSQWCGTGQPRRQKDEGTQILYNADRLIFIRSSTFVLTDSGPTACPPASACSAPSIFSGKRCKHVRIFTHSLFTDFSMEVKLHVLNTHFPLEESEQLLCARQIRNYVARSIPATEAVMLCGDLNSHYAPETTGTPLDALLGEMQDCHGMQDFPTYAEGFLPETLERPRGAHRLDYMLLRPSESVTCLAATMLEPRYRAANGTVSRPSDHEPLRVVLSF